MLRKNTLKAVGVVGLGAILLFSLIAVMGYFHRQTPIWEQFHGTYLKTPRVVSNFSLIGIDEKPFTQDNLKGQWTLLFFGFTHCPSLCPTTMVELAKMYHILQYKKSPSLPLVVMITVDPMRDKRATLGRYVRSFNPAFYGAVGDIKMINLLTQELGVVYEKTSRGRDYTIGHSGVLMLVNPKGQLQAFFTTPHNASLLARDFLLLMS